MCSFCQGCRKQFLVGGGEGGGGGARTEGKKYIQSSLFSYARLRYIINLFSYDLSFNENGNK